LSSLLVVASLAARIALALALALAAGQAEADGRWGVWALSVHTGEARDVTSEFAPGPFDSRDACRLVALEAGVKYLSTLAHTNAVHQMAERGNRPFPPFVTYECREVAAR
jgi:hypothetical protein